MNDTTIVRKYRLFFSWQDEEREAWLAGMSRQGMHLKGLGRIGGFHFVEGPAREFCYRLDFHRSKPEEAYLQLIRDAGWEYIGCRAGWHYWRQEIRGGKIPEIFSDPASKIQMYQRLFTSYITSAPAIYVIGLAGFKKYPERYPLWFVVLYICLFMGWIIFAAINSVMIYRRISRLKRQSAV